MAWQPKVIVVGVDGSETSTEAARIAADMARTWRAKLYMVTVVRPPEGWWGIGGAPPSPEALSTAIVAGQQEVLRDAEAEIDLSGVEYETVEELGDPSWKIIEVAEERQADVIVIGKRGAGLAERVMLGSVADRLSHHSPVPVLVVP
jgi:nucleotide-binding universal stress UspA family protein